MQPINFKALTVIFQRISFVISVLKEPFPFLNHDLFLRYTRKSHGFTRMMDFLMEKNCLFNSVLPSAGESNFVISFIGKTIYFDLF